MPSQLIQSIAVAIDKMEGKDQNNNPGNLRPVGGTGFQVFDSMQAGWDALYKQIQLNINRGLTLEEFFGGKPGVYPGYAPVSDNNRPLAYAKYVSQQTGIPLGVPLNQLPSGTFVSSSVSYPSADTDGGSITDIFSRWLSGSTADSSGWGVESSVTGSQTSFPVGLVAASAILIVVFLAMRD